MEKELDVVEAYIFIHSLKNTIKLIHNTSFYLSASTKFSNSEYELSKLNSNIRDRPTHEQAQTGLPAPF